jgi:hypothetical protein
MKKTENILVYIKNTLQMTAGEFSAEWSKLSDTDKAQMKQWARDEMEAIKLAA